MVARNRIALRFFAMAGWLGGMAFGQTCMDFPGKQILAGSQPTQVGSADFNGDGAMDLVVVNYWSADVSILAGDGQGGFGPPSNHAVGAEPHGVAIGLLNGDGFLDLAISVYHDNVVAILLGNGQGAFAGPTLVPAGSGPSAIAIGELNGDGLADLVLTNLFQQTVSALLGDGQGGFGNPTAFAVGTIPRSLVIDHFNADGSPDLAVANDASSDISILLGNGQGGFSSAATLVVGPFPRSLDSGDINGDGHADIVVARAYDLAVFIGNGQGGFAGPTFVESNFPGLVTLGEFNGDGYPDLATTNGGPNVSMLFGDGQGGFSAPKTYFAGVGAGLVAFAALNGDNHMDLVVTCNPGVSVLLGDGQGETLDAKPLDTSVGFAPVSITSGDLDCNGYPDVAAANYGADQVSVFVGNGQGAYSGSTSVPTADRPQWVVTGELGDDSFPDLVIANELSKDVAVLHGDGLGGFSGPSKFPTGLFPSAIVIGQLDGDGLADLVVASDVFPNVVVLRANGQGGFNTPTQFAALPNPRSVAIGNLDADGFLDIAVAGYYPSNLAVLHGNGQGGFGPPQTIQVGATSAYAVAAVDVNGDGVGDIVLSADSSLYVLLGKGQGGFKSPLAFPVMPGTNGDNGELPVGDVNGDGFVDFVTIGSCVSVMTGDGSGSLDPQQVFGANGTPTSVELDDLNQDGRLDIVIATYSSSKLSVYLNGCASSSPPSIESVVTFAGTTAGNILGNEQVMIVGSGFTPSHTVWFGNQLVPSTTWISPSQIRVDQTPPSPANRFVPVSVTVATPNGQAVLADGYVYQRFGKGMPGTLGEPRILGSGSPKVSTPSAFRLILEDGPPNGTAILTFDSTPVALPTGTALAWPYHEPLVGPGNTMQFNVYPVPLLGQTIQRQVLPGLAANPVTAPYGEIYGLATLAPMLGFPVACDACGRAEISLTAILPYLETFQPSSAWIGKALYAQWYCLDPQATEHAWPWHVWPATTLAAAASGLLTTTAGPGPLQGVIDNGLRQDLAAWALGQMLETSMCLGGYAVGQTTPICEPPGIIAALLKNDWQPLLDDIVSHGVAPTFSGSQGFRFVLEP